MLITSTTVDDKNLRL